VVGTDLICTEGLRLLNRIDAPLANVKVGTDLICTEGLRLFEIEGPTDQSNMSCRRN